MIGKSLSQYVEAVLTLHTRVSQVFLPTAIKFHYLFTLRDLSNVFQGVLFSQPQQIKTHLDFTRLILHEASRVYGDKLIEAKDIETFNKLKIEVFSKFFEDIPQEELAAEPNLY